MLVVFFFFTLHWPQQFLSGAPGSSLILRRAGDILILQKRIGKFGVVFALAVEPYLKNHGQIVSWDDEIHSQLNGKN
jgi:hypothetical protein